MREIVFPYGLFDRLRDYLLQDPQKEQAAFILAGVNVGHDRVRLLARELIPVPREGFLYQGGAFLSIKPEFSRGILWRCWEEGLSLIETHSHPFARDRVSFSGLDTINEGEKFPYVARKIPKIYHATMVFGRNSLDAHMWNREEQTVVPVDQVRVLGCPVKDVTPTSARCLRWSLRGDPAEGFGSAERVSRQVLAFGQEGQRQIERCFVGIVGIGGVGSAVAEMLAHLGVRRLLIIDPDVVETTNLNRLIGARPVDARRRMPKVWVVNRYVRQINPRIEVTALFRSLFDPESLEALKEVDVIMGCTDNHGSRLVLNQLAIKYLIPYLDIGTGIETENGMITAAGGQVRVILPGDFCLECIDGIDRQRAGLDLMSPSERAIRRERGYIEGADVPAPAVIFLNNTLASWAVGEFVNLLTGFKPAHRFLSYDLLQARITAVLAQQRAGCITCNMLALGDLEPFPNFQLRDRLQRVPTIPAEP